MIVIRHNEVIELSFISAKTHADPFNDVEVDVIFEGENGSSKTVPGFWAGDDVWRVRFSSPVGGLFRSRSLCTDNTDSGLHAQEESVRVLEHKGDVLEERGDNLLMLHGPVRVAPDRRHFRHFDGAPFFWLADTWWMGLCDRLGWPEGFQSLALDRVKKSFTTIQIVAGLHPDMPAFDERGANEAGFPWTPDYGGINPAYFDYADRKIAYLVSVGLMPCIVGCWGYFLRFMGVEKVKKHWRYLVARYGAYPVVWCLAGEATMPFYLSDQKDADAEFQKVGWTELARYVRSINAHNNLITIHPSNQGRDEVEDPSVLDFDMLQTGHSDMVSLPGTIETVARAYSREPHMPFVNAEVCYEGIGGACKDQIQRLMFWACILSGAAGHTYGANGIWQVNGFHKPYGPSPHGMSWGDTPWQVAMDLPGSRQMRWARGFLKHLDWWRFEPHPEWIEPHWSKENYLAPYAAGIPGQVRVIYFPPSWWGVGVVKSIEPGVTYHAHLCNPLTFDEVEIGPVIPDADGNWEPPLGTPPWKLLPVFHDWVMVLEARTL